MSNLTLEAIELMRLFGGREAVKNVSFQLEKGEVLGFLGPNGAGKSTTMRMLTGNLAPSIGTVKICGIDMIENPKEAKALIGYLPEMRPIYKELTVDEFLTIAARLHKVPSKQIKKAVEKWLDKQFETERPSLPAISITPDSTLISAIATDISFDEIYAKQVRALAQAGDILLAISHGGNSRNVIKAVEAAVSRDMKIVALTGGDGGEIAGLLVLAEAGRR